MLKASYKRDTFSKVAQRAQAQGGRSESIKREWTYALIPPFQYLSHSLLEPSPVNERKQTEIEGSRFYSQGPKTQLRCMLKGIISRLEKIRRKDI
jgi:hypothetical protein